MSSVYPMDNLLCVNKEQRYNKINNRIVKNNKVIVFLFMKIFTSTSFFSSLSKNDK